MSAIRPDMGGLRYQVWTYATGYRVVDIATGATVATFPFPALTDARELIDRLNAGDTLHIP